MLDHQRSNGAALTGFTPLAASASMPAVIVSSSGRSAAAAPSTLTGAAQTAAAAALATDKAVRGRTSLRRFHSMHAHGHSASGNRSGRVVIRERERDRERERERDTSFTQCAVADDDNVSVLQQITRAGGGN